ncbi:MAG: hypothetical protein ACOCVM_05115 [Desulfovibrionaceae bacterium]
MHGEGLVRIRTWIAAFCFVAVAGLAWTPSHADSTNDPFCKQSQDDCIEYDVAPGKNPQGDDTNLYLYFPSQADNSTAPYFFKGGGPAGSVTLKQNTQYELVLQNAEVNNTLPCYIKTGSTGDKDWAYANGCDLANSQHLARCMACPYVGANYQGLNPGGIPRGESICPGCVPYTAAPAGNCSSTDGSIPAGTNTIMSLYTPSKSADSKPVATVEGGGAAQTIGLKPGAIYEVTVENSQYKEPMSCFIKAGQTGWEFAKGCDETNSKRSDDCVACWLIAGNKGKMTLAPGCAGKAQKVCRDNSQCGEWTKRITITNNCKDPVYMVLTPPKAENEIQTYNAQLWKMTADKAQMSTIYANPKNTNSSELYLSSELKSGDSLQVPVPGGGVASANFGVLLGCNKTPDPKTGWPGECVMGGALPGLPSTGVGTVFEYTAGCMKDALSGECTCTISPSDGSCLSSQDYFDLSQVSGFNIPMSLEVQGDADAYGCSFAKMYSRGDVYDCPSETSATIGGNDASGQPYSNPMLDKGVNLHVTLDSARGWAGCMAPEQWLQPPGGQDPYKNTDTVVLNPGVTDNAPNISDWYACNVMRAKGADQHPFNCTTPGCGGPQCARGPEFGALANDPSPAALAKGKGKPYTNYVKYLKAVGSDAYAWQFNDDASTMMCTRPGASVLVTLCPGPAGQQPYKKQKWAYSSQADNCQVNPKGAYDSLFACMKDKVKYKCASETVEKKDATTKKVLKATLYYCKPVLDGSGEGVSYDECMKNGDYCQTHGQAY